MSQGKKPTEAAAKSSDSRRKILWLGGFIALWGSVMAPACLSGGPTDSLGAIDGSGGGSTVLCVDEDGDGFGKGCPKGLDCDDGDAAITTQCGASTCSHPAPGCPCGAEGERISCGKVESQVGDQIVCGMGESVCTEGKWAECIINNATLLVDDGDVARNTQSLAGPATACAANKCDPYCQTFPDGPGTIVGDPGGGTVIGGGGGVTVPLGDAPPGEIGGGYVCSAASSSGTCAHSLCATGSKLAVGCDVVPIPPQGGREVKVFFEETFANNSKGWSLGTGWAISPAKASTGANGYYGDPGTDHTSATTDNGVAGVVIGGNAQTGTTYDARYLTSPTINTAPAGATTATLEFWRQLNSDGAPYMVNTVQVSTNNGSTWNTLWTSSGAIKDSLWQKQTVDVSGYKSAQFRVRFGVSAGKTTSSYCCKKILFICTQHCDEDTFADSASSWNIDDVAISIDVPAPAPVMDSCVQQICAQPGFAKCCSESWTGDCVAQLPAVCKRECALDNTGACVTCYKDNYDHDGDGFSYSAGDCRDCDAAINPGAFDFPGNGIDEDCSGTPDDAPGSYNAGTAANPKWRTKCDAGLALTSASAWDHAKAIDLCQTTTAAATGPSRKWGVFEAALVQANGTSAPNSNSYAIASKFGTNNSPRGGDRMAVYSSGTARAPGDSGYVAPNGNIASYGAGTSCAFPTGFPKAASGCPNGSGNANDSAGLRLKIRTPTNAKSFSYNFSFFSSEYQEWVCTAYNDSFVALLDSQSPNAPANYKNISFDSNNNPLSVNNGFFSTFGSNSQLANTGFGGTCSGYYCGGGTDWLQTSAPIVPGEDITIHFSIWDTGDNAWDSTVLIDNWQWSPNSASIVTTKPLDPPPPPPPTYSDGYFVRDYSMKDVCPQGSSITWGLWSWTSATPSDSKIEFLVQTADTQAGLDAAPRQALRFSNPPGPTALSGQSAIARKAPTPNTENGSAVVDTTLKALGWSRVKPFVRVTSHLVPSTDKLSAPSLNSWNLQSSCTPSE